MGAENIENCFYVCLCFDLIWLGQVKKKKKHACMRQNVWGPHVVAWTQLPPSGVLQLPPLSQCSGVTSLACFPCLPPCSSLSSALPRERNNIIVTLGSKTKELPLPSLFPQITSSLKGSTFS